MAVSGANILIFTQQFASMIRSKLPLCDVLDNLAAETPQRRLRESIETVADDVRHGTDLAQAMEDHPRIFDSVYVNVVRAGMESGRLGEALSQIAHYLKMFHETARKVRSALTYPLFVVTAFFGIFNAMVFGILPRFQSMYANMHRKLPMPTQLLIDLGDYWKENWVWIISAMVATAVSFTIWVSTPDGRAIFDRYKLRLPVLGALWRMGALARFLRTFAVQVENEVSVLQALRLGADTSGNVYIRDIIYDIAEEVELGRGLADSFRDHAVFHGIVLQMIAAGEEAGILDVLLMSSADYFDSLVQDLLDRTTQLINPTLTVLVGLAIGAMMVAAFMPVFQMGAAVGGGG